MKTTLLTVNPPQRLARLLPCLSALICLVGFNLQADAPPTTLHLAQPVADTEGLATYRLDWNAVSNATYLVQSATDLASAGAWQTIDVVTPTNSAGLLEIKGRSIPENSVEYFRLILPQPQIFSVEPAVFAPGVPVDFYVIGQCFPTNAELRIKNVPQSGTLYQNSTTLVQPSFTPDVAGDYQFSLVVGGQVVSSFTGVCADAFANPELVLQGPPTVEPPASPSFPARSKQSEAKSNTKAMFTAQKARGRNPDLDDEGDSGPIAQAGARVRKGMQDLKNFAQDFEIQEGKKGLNAVNVKLARMAGGGGSGGSMDLFHAWPSGYYPPALTAREPGKRVLWGLGGNLDISSIAARTVVMPFSGEVEECDVDLAIPGRGLDFVWARVMRFRPGNQGVINFTVTRWTHSYDVAVAQTAAGIALADGTGRVDTYKLQTNGTYTCPEFFREGTLSNNTFTLTFADTGRWVFQPFDGSSAAGKLRQIITRNGDTMTLGYDPSGRLTEVVDDLGRTNTVGYDSDGRLASVTDFSGRTVTYQYYQGLPGEKGGAGDLKSVTSPPVTGTPNGNDFPAGKTTTYTYSTGYPDDRENHLLLSVIDAKGETTHQYVYQHNQTDFDFLRCISVQRGTNAPTMLTYLPQPAAPTNQFATLRCIVNDPVGNVTECFFDARGRCVKSQEFTGRATPGSPVTATVNRPAGKLRTSDPDYYETLAEWNNDSLLTKVKREYSGDKTFSTWRNKIFSYASDFDPATPARKRADCRVVREIASSPVDLDGDGTADATERVWRYEYDPRFGSSAKVDRRSCTIKFLTDNHLVKHRTCTVSSMNDQHKRAQNPCVQDPESDFGFSFTREKMKGTTGNPHGDAHLGRYFDFEIEGLLTGGIRAISSTDPRGNVTTAEYDEQGNQSKERLVANNGGNGIEVRDTKIRHNARGQLTAITNAPDATGFARVDTFDYYTNGPQQGYLKSCVVDAGGLALTESYEYDARGNVTRFVDRRGHDSLYTYNALDQLARYQTPTNLTARCTTDFTYDANDNVVASATELRDENDAFVRMIVPKYTFDVLDRCVSVVQQVSANSFVTNIFSYDANDNVAVVYSPLAVSGADPSNITQLEFDERGLLFREISAPGTLLASTNEYAYDANQKPASFSIGIGVTAVKGTFSVARDGFGRPVTVADPLSNIVTSAYDRNDNLVYQRVDAEPNDGPGSAGNLRYHEWRGRYNALDQCIEARTAFFDPATQTPVGDGDAVTTFAYAPNGACTSITDDLGRVTSLTYDTVGWLASVTSPSGKAKIMAIRDALGNVRQPAQTCISDLGGPVQVFAWTNVYDSLSRCVSTTDNVGNTNRYAYDSLGNVISTVDARDNETVFTYDDLSRPVATTNYEGLGRGITINTSHVEYNSNSRIVSSTDANTNTTFYAYDSLDRLMQTTEADGTISSLVWSPRSNLVRAEDANGTVITNTYDLLDRLVRRDITPGPGVAATTTFETFAYDGVSQLVAATNDATHNEFAYDSLGRNTRGTSGGLGAVVSTHDSVGNRISMTYPSGRVVTYAYDVLNQVTNVSSSAGGLPPTTLATFAYEGPGRVGRIVRANNVNTRILWDGLVAAPNGAGDSGWGQVSGINHQVAGGAVIDQRVFTYDQKQNKTLRAQTVPFYQGGDMTTNVFEYDALDRLSRAINTKGTGSTLRTYVLDGNDNRQLVLSNGVAEFYVMDATIPPGDFQMNQYTLTPFGAQNYDENGNLVVRAGASGPTFYHYDYADRLVEVAALNGGGKIGLVASFSYDALGRRFSKTVFSDGGPPTTTEYVHDIVAYKDNDDRVRYVSRVKFESAATPYKDGEANEMRSRPGRILEEHVGGLLTRDYAHTPEFHDWFAGGLVAAFTGTGQPQYYHCDDLGNVLALTGANGAVVERYDYDDFGLPIFLSTDGLPTGETESGVGNPFLFHGMEWDAETGLYHDGGMAGDNPFYDPKTGRATRGKVKDFKDNGMGFASNNPWSGGGSPGAMKKGTVKFFNETKGFGRVGSGGPVSTSVGGFKKMKDSVIQNIR